MISLQGRCEKHRQNQVFSIRGGLTFGKINPEVLFYGTSGRDFMLLGVLPDSNISEYYAEQNADGVKSFGNNKVQMPLSSQTWALALSRNNEFPI